MCKRMEMYKDTVERSKHKYSHVTIQNGSEQDSPNVNGSPGVRKESIEIKMYQCVSNHGSR